MKAKNHTQGRKDAEGWKGWRGVRPWVVPLGLLALWWGLSCTGVLPSRILPPPGDVLQAGTRLLASGELWRHFLVSFQRAAVGLLIGGGIGFTLGLFTGLYQQRDRQAQLLHPGTRPRRAVLNRHHPGLPRPT